VKILLAILTLYVFYLGLFEFAQRVKRLSYWVTDRVRR
jgi:hypothetical protein